MVHIRTSHVGSFPLDYTHENVERVLLDLYKLGIDVPPYPQLRSFVDIYLKPLESAGHLHNREGRYYIVKDRIDHIPKTDIVVFEAEDAIRVIRKHGIIFKWIRAPVTGIFTLASRVYVINDASKGLSATCLASKDITLEVLREFVKKVVRYMVGLGFNVIFIDEPVFNYIIGRRKILYDYSDDEIVDVLDSIAGSHPNTEFGIHVCGKINSKILDIVLRTQRIRYINIELHDSPSNIDLISKESLEKYDKFIAPGVVSAQKLSVENIDEVLNILRIVHMKSGNRVDLISGDCGFGGLKGSLGDHEKEYNVSLAKLRAIVDSVKKFKEQHANR